MGRPNGTEASVYKSRIKIITFYWCRMRWTISILHTFKGNNVIHSNVKNTDFRILNQKKINVCTLYIGSWNPLGWTLTWIFNSCLTKTKKFSNHFFKNLWISDQDKLRMKTPGRKGMGKLPGNGKITGDENCLTLKNPCFIMECRFS